MATQEGSNSIGQQPGIPQPGNEVYEYKAGSNINEHLLRDPQPVFKFLRYDKPTKEKPDIYGNTAGVYVYLEGVKYPTKGFPTPAAAQANNIAKRALMEWIMLFKKHPLMLIPMIFNRKSVKDFIFMYCSFSGIVLGQYFWEKRYYSNAARELWKFTEEFMKNLGMDMRQEVIGMAYNANPGRVVAHIMEKLDFVIFANKQIIKLKINEIYN